MRPTTADVRADRRTVVLHASKVPAAHIGHRRVNWSRLAYLMAADELARHRAPAAGPNSTSRGCRPSGSRSGRCDRRPRGSAGRTSGCCPAPGRSSRSSPAGSLHVSVAGLKTHSRVLLSTSNWTCTSGSCHFHRPSCGRPHMLRVSTPPNCAMPGGDRAVDRGGRRGQEARHGAGVAEAVGMEGGHHHGAGATLGGADDAVPAGRQALVGGQPVRQLDWTGTSPTAGCRPAPSWCTGSRHRPPARPPRYPCRPGCSSRCPRSPSC